MRSNLMKQGLEKYPHRSLLKAMGLTDREIDQPIIGIAPYQRRILTDPARLIALVKSRRIGGTWIVAMRESLRALGFGIRADGQVERMSTRGCDQHIISASQEQAMKHLDDCRTHLQALTAGSNVATMSKESSALAVMPVHSERRPGWPL